MFVGKSPKRWDIQGPCTPEFIDTGLVLVIETIKEILKGLNKKASEESELQTAIPKITWELLGALVSDLQQYKALAGAIDVIADDVQALGPGGHQGSSV